ncbi:protein XRI1-like isoform X2 [Phalaenopsis equestris]|uniref:protein XRI1-like isoform X2 n=1 Tax=Phalaenopsis equestris TaxID=78828 RepID=UPI0009E577E2|nr:protein XRI1-like isoform X2 [Phalaenopsis equestris]
MLSPVLASHTSFMDLNEQGTDNNYVWEWQGDDYYLKENLMKDISCSFWDEANHNEDSFMYMLEVQTPIKDCADFDYQTMDIEDNINKMLGECGDSSLRKRRRMLHFPLDADETAIGNAQSTSFLLRYKEGEDEQIDYEPSSPTNSELNPQCNIGIAEGNCGFNSESWDQPSEGWFDNCFDESVMQYETDETTAPIEVINYLNCDETSNLQGHGPDLVQESKSSGLHRIGRKSFIGTSTKLTSSVAYPFALIKPCGLEGDLTLKDINQRLHPPSLSSKNTKDEDASLSYPTSAFSGKPVVVKTKIRTEGGKGSITIMRTKGSSI